MASLIHEPGRPRKPWRVDWWQQGRHRTRRFGTRREAQAFLAQTTAGPVHTVRVTLTRFAQEWGATHWPTIEPSTAATYGRLLDRWVLPYLGGARLETLGRGDLKRWRVDALAGGATPGQVNKAHAVLRIVLGAAVDEDHIAANPAVGMRRLPEPRVERVPATIHQVEAIRAAMATAKDRLDVVLMAYAGLRPSEVQHLQPGDLTRGHVTVQRGARSTGHTKTGIVRVVPLIGPAGDDVDAAGVDGVGFGDQDNWRKRVWRPAVAAAGVGPVTPYALRHTFASLLIAEGRTVHEVAALLGHSTPALTLSTYGHLFAVAQLGEREDMAGAVARVRRGMVGGG